MNIIPQSNTDFTQVTCTVHFYYRIVKERIVKHPTCIGFVEGYFNIDRSTQMGTGARNICVGWGLVQILMFGLRVSNHMARDFIELIFNEIKKDFMNFVTLLYFDLMLDY